MRICSRDEASVRLMYGPAQFDNWQQQLCTTLGTPHCQAAAAAFKVQAIGRGKCMLALIDGTSTPA